MTPGTESWNRGQKKPGNRPLRRLLILCEDTKSSRDYLSQFPFDQAQVAIECVGTGMNTDSLMEEAIRRKKKADSGHRSNPSTRVHELIKELRRFDPAQQKP